MTTDGRTASGNTADIERDGAPTEAESTRRHSLEIGARGLLNVSPDPDPGLAAQSTVSLFKHPVHPMLVTFPIAFLIGALGSDIMALLTGDEFWVRVSLWLIGGGTVMGTLAGIAGTVELLAVAEIRHRVVAWMHFVAAVMLLAVAFTNWIYRIDAPAGQIAELGIYLSALTVLWVAVAGWIGGHLVFAHGVGVEED